MARDQEITSLDPANAGGNANLFAQIQVFDGLVLQLPGFKDPQPGLAESWTVAPDNLTYTFKLRPAKFSDGTPITPSDVKFDLERAIDVKQDATFSFLYTNVASVTTAGTDQVIIKTKVVDASLLPALTLPPSGIYPKAAFEKLGATRFATNPIGSGPYMVKNYKQGSSLELVKNPDYWATGKPYLDGVTFNYVKDANARVLQITSGETDVAQTIPYDQIKSLSGKSNFKVVVAPYNVIWSVWLNNSVKPLDDKLVRQALNYATPKSVLNDVIIGGYGTPQNSMTSATTYWDSTVPAIPYDIDKAKSLIAQSSSPKGFKIPLLITGGNNAQRQAAEILQSEWAKIGVTVDIKAQDESVNNDQYFAGKYTARIFSPTDISSDTPDDSEQASIMLDGTNDNFHGFWTYYNNPAATALVKQGVATLDPAKRKAAYAALQRVGMEDVPQVAMLFVPTATGVSNKVSGFQPMPSGWWRLEDVCLAKS